MAECLTRVRIIHTDGSIAVTDFAHSQICALLKPLSDAERNRFYARPKQGGDNVLPDGRSIHFVKEFVG